MIGWFKRKSKLEVLESRYRDLMKKSFDVSSTDPKRSDKLHRQADKIFEEIKYLSVGE